MVSSTAQPARAFRPPEAASGRSPRAIAVLLGCVLFFVYLANVRNLSPDDTIPARYLPFAILTRHTLNVDGYVERHAQFYLNGTIGYGPYFVVRSHGHWMSTYPIVTSILVTPLYVAPAWWAQHRGMAPGSDSITFFALAMDKASAAFLAALGVAIFYLALRRLLPPRGALLVALIYAVASPTWNVSSQALWLQNVTELSFVLLIWALVGDAGSRRAAAWIGIALALAVANKLTNSLIAFPVIAWFCWNEVRHRRDRAAGRMAALFAPLVIVGSLVLWYNLHYFGSVFGGYTAAFETLGYGSVASGFRGNAGKFFEGVAGLLVSPNRGLFIFVPWTLLAIAGAVRLWRDRRFPWAPWLLTGAALVFLIYAKLERWYGGYTFGPRYCVDLLPILAFCLAPLWQQKWTAPRRAIAGALVLLAVAVQLIGVLEFPNGSWNETPVSVDVAPERVWDWRDPQILRTLRAGPAPTKLLDHLRGKHKF